VLAVAVVALAAMAVVELVVRHQRVVALAVTMEQMQLTEQ